MAGGDDSWRLARISQWWVGGWEKMIMKKLCSGEYSSLPMFGDGKIKEDQENEMKNLHDPKTSPRKIRNETNVNDWLHSP